MSQWLISVAFTGQNSVHILEEIGVHLLFKRILGLLATPMRAAKALMFFTKGYEDSIETAVKNAVFHEQTDDIVIVKDIEMFRYSVSFFLFPS